MISSAYHQFISTIPTPYSSFLVTFIVLIISLFYWLGFGRFKLLKKLDIDGPRPAPFVGHLLDLAKHQFRYHSLIDTYYKKYGKVFGMYLQAKPTIFVSDPEIIKQILVKDFAKFHDRKFVVDFPSPQDKALSIIPGERWKFIRNTLTPTFTSGKMRVMTQHINDVADTLIDLLRKSAEKNDQVDIAKLQQGLAMETILSVAFGVEAKSQSDSNDKIKEKAKMIVRWPWWLEIVALIPFCGKLIRYIPWTIKSRFKPIENIARVILQKRRKENETRKDFIYLMLEAQKEADNQGRTLTDDEIVAQCFVFLVAGYESSSTTLSFASYHMAKYPEIQERLYDEVMKYCPEGTKPDYDSVQHMQYLDQVISETLRLYPPGFLIIRQCNEACIIKGIKFPKGINIAVPVYSIHRDPAFWNDPEKFDPERFSPDAKDWRSSYTYLPFGQGPRHCIGMRFAQVEMKIVLARIIRDFRLEKTQDTNVPPKILAKGIPVFTVGGPIMIKAVKRR